MRHALPFLLVAALLNMRTAGAGDLVVVVNPSLAGVSEMIESLSRSRSPKIVTIRDHDKQDAGVYGHATLERPSGLGVISQQDWLGCVRRLVKDLHTVPVACPEFS